MIEHFSIDLYEDEEGWWPARCKCGEDLGFFPTAEDACDALIDHAYSEGWEEAIKHSEQETRP